MSKVSLLIAAGISVCAATAFAGNGAPSGAHYNLNILGKTQCSGDDLTGSSRHTIQVLLNGGQKASDVDGTLASEVDKRNKIYLREAPEGESFAVLDGNACDNDGAVFQLPNPYPDGDLSNAVYEIYVRALGKPGGEADITTCATGEGEDLILGTADDEIVCSTGEDVNLIRTKGKQTFTNVTRALTTVTYSDCDLIDEVVVCEEVTVGLFDPALYDYFWNYENRGLRLAQLRFYPAAE
jgi:hypothetical protein